MTREEAIRIIETVFQDEYVYKYYDSITHQALDMAIKALSAEHVVRCSECKYVGHDATTFLVCDRKGMGLKPFHVYHDDYCSYGERREDGGA